MRKKGGGRVRDREKASGVGLSTPPNVKESDISNTCHIHVHDQTVRSMDAPPW